jgi:N-acetylmuramoyl-L-alanine amidase
MTKRLRSIVCAVIATLAMVAKLQAADRAPEMYAAAFAQEQAVRMALDAGDAPAGTARQVHAVVAAYQEIVRRFPTSGYCDNALWQAGVLSLDAFAAFGQERDKTAAARLLRLLASEYPTSSLLKEIPAQLARANGSAAGSTTEPAVPLVARTAATSEPLRLNAPVERPAGVAARPRGSLATIKSIRREILTDAVRVTIELDHEVSFHDERIPGPVRVFVDLPATRAAPALVDKTIRFDGDNDIVRQIRIGRHPDNMTRVVLDGADVASYSVYPLYEPYRLVIDCVRVLQPSLTSVNAARVPEPAVAAVPVTTVATVTKTAPTLTPAPPPAATRASAANPPPAPLAEPLPGATSTTAPPRNANGGYSMARQLGLRVSRIVIDPGHGGHDPGAQGKSIDEAELVLDVALRVEKLLEKVPGVEVILTRRTDDFVPLPERTALANREGADLFLSIHANASENASVQGIETYFLNFASNMSAASVAARENAASGQAMGALPDFLKAIALNNKLDESRDFALAVQGTMVERLRRTNKAVRDLGVKQAPFVVLIGAAMPSVLTEISFLTNSQEAKLLRGSGYRERIAEALVVAIRKYQTSLNSVAKIAER